MVLVLSTKAQEPSIILPTSEYEIKGNTAFNNTKLKQAAYYYQLASNEYLEQERFEDYVKVNNYRNYLFYEFDQIDSFEINAVSTYEVAKKHLSPNNPQFSSVISQLSTYYFTKCDYVKSHEINFELLKEAKNSDAATIATYYSNIGNGYKLLGDEKSALQYLLLAEKTLAQDESNPEFKYKINQSIAHIYRSQKKYEEAKELYLEAKKIVYKNNLDYLKCASNLWLAEIEALTNNYNTSITLLNEAKKVDPRDTLSRIRIFETQEFIFDLQGSHQLALNAISKAQVLAEDSGKRMINLLQINRLLNLAKSNQKLGKIDQALEAIQKGLQLFTLEDNSDVGLKIYHNPPLENFYNAFSGFQLLNNKTALLLEKYKITENREILEETLNTGLLAIELNSAVRKNILSEESKVELSANSKLVLQNTFEACYILYSLTDDKLYQKILFEIAERGKASLMLEKFLYNTANQNSIIPDSIIAIEKNIQSQLTYLKKEVFRNNGKEKKLQTLNNEIATLNKEFDVLIKDLEKNYPLYYQIKFNTSPIEIEALQKQLASDNKNMLIYFEGIDHYYGLMIQGESVQIKKLLKIEDVIKANDAFQIALQRKEKPESAKEEFNTFTEKGLMLYKKMVQPLVKKENKNPLIIIPDGVLAFMPFETLIMTKPKGLGYSLDKLDYVFENNAISYDYSATFYHINSNKEVTKEDVSFVGFAPSFENTESFVGGPERMKNLTCSVQEIDQLVDLTHGTAFINNQATSNTLVEEINQYDIVHLATHAFIDNSEKQNHQVYFSDKTLSSIEIEGMTLDNELVVLSACNTGQGKLRDGEGVFSLARGFLNAGCKSVLMSLWPVGDCSTAEIMQLFYKNMKDGYDKDESLRLAKIEYLKNSPKLKQHPSYWSPFLAYGNMDSLTLPKKNFRLPVVILSASLLLALAIYFSRQKTN